MLTDNSKKFWIFEWGTDSSYKAWDIHYGTGTENCPSNYIWVHVWKLIVQMKFFNIIPPFRKKIKAVGWSEDDIKRLGRDWYWDVYERKFGVSIFEGMLSIKYGRSTWGSTTDKDICFFLPWRQRRHIRSSLYDIKGEHWHSEHTLPRKLFHKFRNSWDAVMLLQDSCPSVKFELKDYDGQKIIATTRIEEREWLYGEKWCWWLSWFVKPLVRRSLDIDYSSETGKAKGSWKGGTTGEGIDMISPEELHEEAMKRHCEKEHRSKHGKYKLEYIKKIKAPKKKTEKCNAQMGMVDDEPKT